MSSVLTSGSKCRDRIVGYAVGVGTVGESPDLWKTPRRWCQKYSVMEETFCVEETLFFPLSCSKSFPRVNFAIKHKADRYSEVQRNLSIS